MKKMLFWILVLTMCVSIAAEVIAQEPATINVPKVLGWVTTNGLFPAIAEKLADKNITVVPIESDNMTLREKQLMAAANKTGEIDVYIAWEAFQPLMKDYVEPLDDYLIKAGINLEEFKNKWYPSVLDQITIDGKICWIPIHVNHQVGYARTDLFKDPKEQENFKAEYGYDMPIPDKTGTIMFKDKEQFVDVAKFFTRDTNNDGEIDLWGYDPPGKWDHGCCVFEEILLRSGLEYFDPEGHSMWGPAHSENQQVVQGVVQWMQDLVLKDKVVSPGTVGMEMTEVNQLFKEGKAAMSFTWNVDFWGENTKPEVMKAWGDTIPSSWSIDFVNIAPEYKGIMSIWGYALNKDSKNKAAAVEFLLACADSELRKGVHSTAGLPCGNGEVELTEWLVENNYAPGAVVAGIQSVGSFWPISKTPWEETESVRDVCRENLEKLLSGTLSPSEFVKVTGEKIEGIMKDAGHF